MRLSAASALTLLASACSQAQAVLVAGRILGLNSSLDPHAFVRLASPSSALSAPVLLDGHFSLDAPPGDHVLSVVNRIADFPQLAIRLPEGEGSPHVAFHQVGHSAAHLGPSLPYPLLLYPTGMREYWEVKKPFDPVKAITKNPLMIVLVLGGLLTAAMPFIIKRLDPELLAEVQASQGDMHKKMAALQQGDLSALLAPPSEPGSGATTPSGARTPTGNTARKRK